MYNANNYGYNPYVGYQPQRQPQQMLPTQMSAPLTNVLNGKKVDSIETAMVSDSSMDGNVNYYAVSDGSAIVTKQLQLDGTSKTIVYKPVSMDKQEDKKYVTIDDLTDLEDEIKDLKQELKELKKKKKDE